MCWDVLGSVAVVVVVVALRSIYDRFYVVTINLLRECMCVLLLLACLIFPRRVIVLVIVVFLVVVVFIVVCVVLVGFFLCDVCQIVVFLDVAVCVFLVVVYGVVDVLIFCCVFALLLADVVFVVEDVFVGDVLNVSILSLLRPFATCSTSETLRTLLRGFKCLGTKAGRKDAFYVLLFQTFVDVLLIMMFTLMLVCLCLLVLFQISKGIHISFMAVCQMIAI